AGLAAWGRARSGSTVRPRPAPPAGRRPGPRLRLVAVLGGLRAGDRRRRRPRRHPGRAGRRPRRPGRRG
ncbi:MAG: hypothetical protein AVDCRST_MAG41-3893, partial [uncultured Corynebacteriales bacterium]